MELPRIYINIWDLIFAVPIVMILTQLVKWFTPVKKLYIPAVAVAFGLVISIFYSHPHSLAAGVIMGYFYGYAAIGRYAATKNYWRIYRNEKNNFTEYDN